MPAISVRHTKIGDVVKHEYQPSTGYSREEATVTVPAGGLEIGAVLESTSVPGKYTLVAVLTGANADGVLIEDAISDQDTYGAGGDFSLVVMTKGPAQVADKSLTYNADVNDATKKGVVNDALLANTGIEVVTQV